MLVQTRVRGRFNLIRSCSRVRNCVPGWRGERNAIGRTGEIAVAWWKRIAIGLGILIVLGGIGGVVAFMLTAGPADAATAFVKEIGRAGPEAAYKDAASALRLAESEAVFEAQMRQWHLTEAADASWPSRSFANGRVTLKGIATLRGGTTLPLRAELVKVGDKWAVSALALDAGTNTDSD